MDLESCNIVFYPKEAIHQRKALDYNYNITAWMITTMRLVVIIQLEYSYYPAGVVIIQW